MEFQWKILPIFFLSLLSGLFTITECRRPQASVALYADLGSSYTPCRGLDSCNNPRTNDPWKYNCNCDEYCSFLRTCCFDSKYRRKYKQKYLGNVECRQLNNRRSFLYPWIRTCNPEMQYDKTTEELCTSRGIQTSDPFLEVPVTDPLTGITYQNYYCFGCNEKSGEERLIPWNAAIGGDLEKVNRSSTLPNLRNYEKESYTWVMDNDNSTHLSLWQAIPEELEKVLPFCYGFEIVSKCASSWTEVSTTLKCLAAYMALTRVRKGTESNYFGTNTIYKYYRNPHCAICNYESVNDMVCVAKDEFPIISPGGLLPSGDFFVRLFELQSNVQCRKEKVYDKFSKKCRNIYRARKRVS